MYWKKGRIILLFIFLMVPCVHADTYTIDTVHSRVGFTVKHMMINRIHGQFDKYSGWFTYDPAHPEAATAFIRIDMESVNTGNKKRDNHLRSKAFFDAEKYPEMIFRITSVEMEDKNNARVKGKMTIHGVTRQIKMNVEGGDIVRDPWGGTRSGFTISTTINRKDFGLTWNKVLETGGVVVGDKVKIEVDIEGILKKNKR